MTLAERRGGRTAGKGGRQRERERGRGMLENPARKPVQHGRRTSHPHASSRSLITALSRSTPSSSLLSPPTGHCAYVLFFSRASPGLSFRGLSLSHLPFSSSTLRFFLPGSLSLSLSLPRCLLLPSYFLYPVSARIYRDILRYPSSVSLFLSIFFSHTALHTLRP